MYRPWLFLLVLGSALLGPVDASRAQEARPIKVLLISGASGDEFREVNPSLMAGIEERLRSPIDWTVKNASSDGEPGMKSVFPNAGWADGYDVVIHHHYFNSISDGRYLDDRVLYPHTRGKPAVLVGRASTSFSGAGDSWSKLSGAQLDGESLSLTGAKVNVLLKSSESDQPEVWTNLFDGHTRVFCHALPFLQAKNVWPEYLDSVARGMIWAMEKEEAQLFNSGQGGESPEVAGKSPLPGVKRVEIGSNLLEDAEVSAFSLPAMPQEGMSRVVDGDSITSWKLDGSGPGSLTIQIPEEREVELVTVVLDTGAKDFLLEAKCDGWESLEAAEASNEDEGILLYRVDGRAISGLRFSFPGGRQPGIREVVAYGNLKDVPEDLLSKEQVREWKSSRKKALASGEAEKPVNWSPRKVVPTDSMDVRQLVAKAEGGVWLFVRNFDKDGTGSVWNVGEELQPAEFLHSTSPGAGIAWDGEWVYVAEPEVRGRGEEIYSVLVLKGYRDTNDDGKADERFEFAEVDLRSAGIEGVAGSGLEICDMAMGPVGEFYAILSSDAGEYWLIRFRKKQDVALPLLVSFRQLLGVSVSVGGEIRVSALPEKGGVAEIYRSDLIPGVSIETIDPLPYEAIRGAVRSGPRSHFKQLPTREWLEIYDQVNAVATDGRGAIWLYGGMEGVKPVLSRSVRTDVAIDKPFTWDSLSDKEVVELFVHDRSSIRFEAVFEFARRKRAFRGPILQRYDAATGDEDQELAWLRVSAFEGSGAVNPVASLASRSEFPEVRALAFYCLGDHRGEVLAGAIARVQEETSPLVSASMLGAAARQKLQIEGLEELAKNFVVGSAPELVSASSAYLASRGISVERPQVEGSSAIKEEKLRLGLILRTGSPSEISHLIDKAKESRSSKSRREIVAGLAESYQEFDPEVQGLVADYLNELLSSVRVDPGFLLEVMSRHAVPVRDPAALVAVAKQNLHIESKVILLLDGTGLAQGTSEWLEAIAKDGVRDLELRLRAVSLLAANADESLLRRITSLVDDWKWSSISRQSLAGFWSDWISNPAQAEQIAWLVSETKSSNAMRREMAWRALIEIYHTGKDETREIEARFKAVASVGGDRLEELAVLAAAVDAKEIEILLLEADTVPLEEE